MSQTIVAFSDLHLPWYSLKAMRYLYRGVRDIKPDVIICCGDLYDFYSYGRFARSQNVCTPSQEIKRARRKAEMLWGTMRRASPQAICHQLLGNHDSRFEKRLQALFPEAETLVNWRDLFYFDGVITQKSERDELIIGDVCFMHGYKSKLGDHARHNQMNTVVGHTHRGGMLPIRLGDKTIWELNVGYLADRSAIPLGYTKQRQFSTWTPGYGVIDKYGPRFVPL